MSRMWSVHLKTWKSLEIETILMVSAFFFIPFDLPIMAVIRHDLPAVIKNFYWFFHPITLLALLILVRILRGREILIRRTDILLFFLLGTSMAISGWVNGSSSDYLLPKLYLWPGAAALIVLAVDTPKKHDIAARSFLLGTGLWCILFLILFIVGVSTLFMRYPRLSRFSLDHLLIALRYPAGLNYADLYYYKYLGNLNKASNYVLLGMILNSLLYLRGSLRLRYWIAAMAVMGLALLVFFSRGALLGSALAGIAFLGSAVLKRARSQAFGQRHLLIGALFLMVFACSIATAFQRHYWTDFSTLVERENQLANLGKAADSGGAKTIGVGKAEDEFVNAQERAFVGNNDKLPTAFGSKGNVSSVAWRRIIFGYGPGLYGPTIGRRPEAQTHFLLADAWCEGGIPGLIVLLFLFIYPILQSLRASGGLSALMQNDLRSVGLLGVIGIFVLGLREFSFEYLFCQCSGTVLFCLFFLASSRPFANGAIQEKP